MSVIRKITVGLIAAAAVLAGPAVAIASADDNPWGMSDGAVSTDDNPWG